MQIKFPLHDFKVLTDKILKVIFTFCLGLLLLQIEASGNAKESPTSQYEVVSIESQTEMDRKKAGMSLSLSPTKMVPQDIQTPQDGPDGDDSGWCYHLLQISQDLYNVKYGQGFFGIILYQSSD